MRQSFAWIGGLCIAALFVPQLPAQSDLERKTSIDVTAAAPRDVFGSLARTLGCELIIAPEIQQPVTMRLEHVTVRTALTAVSETVGCRWSIDGTTLRVQPAAPPKPAPAGIKGGVAGGVSGGVVGGVPGGGAGKLDFKQRLERKTPENFRFANTPLRAVMDSLGKVADLELRVEDPDGAQPVTVDLGNRTILAAFKSILEQAGLKKGVVFVATIPGSDKRMWLKMGPQKKTN